MDRRCYILIFLTSCIIFACNYKFAIIGTCTETTSSLVLGVDDCANEKNADIKYNPFCFKHINTHKCKDLYKYQYTLCTDDNICNNYTTFGVHDNVHNNLPYRCVDSYDTIMTIVGFYIWNVSISVSVATWIVLFINFCVEDNDKNSKMP